jgi:hypothetical protein
VAHINLEAVADTLAIQHLLARYPVLVDSGDLDALDDLFTADAHLDFSGFGGPNAGLTEMKEFLKGNLALFARTQHMMGLPLITLNAHTATARTPCHNPMVIEQKDGTTQAWLIGLVYDDEFVETAEGWRFASRTATRVYSVVGLADTPLSG